MISELLEIVFEYFPIDKLSKVLLGFIKSDDNIVTYEILDNGEVEFNEKEIVISIENIDDIMYYFKKRYTHTVVINTLKLYLNNDDYLRNTSINIREIRDGVFSFEINFYSHETSYTEPKELCQGLMKFTDEIAKQFDIKNYYCGLEPAELEDNKLFTRSILGDFYEEFINSES